MQILLPEDYATRKRFCKDMLRHNRNDPQCFQRILWSDESLFQMSEIFNIHNLHHWEYVNPRIVSDDRFQH